MAVEVGTAYVTIVPSAKGFASKLSSEVGDAGGKAGATQGKSFSGKFGGAIKGLGAAVAGAFAVSKITEGISKSISLASDMNETTSKSDTIFGKNAASMRDWASTAATSLGQSSEEALASAAGFGDMFSQIGFSSDAAAKMSKSTVQMSADLGSFNNLPTADVQERISAAFRGEYDSLQAVIPNISAARVEHDALAATGKKSAKELTAQEKATAVLGIVQKDGNRAMGDFAKTSGGLANQQKIASAQAKDLGAKFGALLLPIVVSFEKVLTGKVLPAITGFVNGMKDGTGAGGTFADIVKTLVDNWKPIATVLGIAVGLIVAYNVAVGISAAVTKIAAVGQWLMNAALSANPIGLIILLIVGLVAGIILLYKNSETFRAIIQAVWAAIKIAFFAVVNAIKVAFGAVVSFFQGFGGAISAVWNAIKAGAAAVWAAIKGVVVAAVSGLVNAAKAVFNGFRAAVAAVWNAIKGAASAVWAAIKAVVLAQANALVGAAKAVFNGFKAAVSAIWNGIKSAASAVWNAIKTAVVRAVTLLVSTAKAIFNGYKAALGAIWNGIKSAASSAWNAIKSAVVNAVTALVSSAKAKIAAFKAAISAVWSAIKGAASSAWNAIKSAVVNVVTGMISAVRGKIDSIKGILSRAWSGIKSAASAAWKGVKDAITRPIEAAVGVVRGIIDRIKSAISSVKGIIPGLAAGGEVHVLPGRAGGGTISGPGSSTSDSILGIDRRTKRATTWVSDQEFVVNAAAYKRNKALVQMINSGLNLGYGGAFIPGRAGGGLVGFASSGLGLAAGGRVTPGSSLAQDAGSSVTAAAMLEAVREGARQGIADHLTTLDPRQEFALVRRANQYGQTRGGNR